MKFNSLKNTHLFWQPEIDWFKRTSCTRYGKFLLVFLNYIIWVFLFYLSYLFIRQTTNIFWQLFVATVLSELIEKFLKVMSFWKRPMHIHQNIIPIGLIKSWYQRGSFPSGHTIKATFFFLFLLQNPVVISPQLYLLIVIPLIIIRIIFGLHYPIDVLGGLILGILIWIPVHFLVFPDFLVNLVHTVFNFVFFIS